MDNARYERAVIVKKVLDKFKHDLEALDDWEKEGRQVERLDFSARPGWYHAVIRGQDDGFLDEMWELCQKKLAEKVEALQKEFDAL